MRSDRVVFWAALVIVVGVWGAAALGWLGSGTGPLIIAIAVTLFAALAAAVQFDRKFRTGAASFDANRPELYAPMGNRSWQVPTPYIDHPSGGGTPPGVDDSAGILEHDLEERPPRVEDQAP